MLTRPRPICPPDPHPPPDQRSLSHPSQPPHAQTASLHQVIQALHERAAQPNPSIYTRRKKRQYDSAYCVEHTVDKQIIKAEPPIHRVLDDEAKIFVSGHFAFTSIHDDESKVFN
jgi:hypothetical protein